jgi:hypothetical protein
LVTLKNATIIDLSGNYDIPEEDLDILEEALGSNIVRRPE